MGGGVIGQESKHGDDSKHKGAAYLRNQPFELFVHGCDLLKALHLLIVAGAVFGAHQSLSVTHTACLVSNILCDDVNLPALSSP